MAAVTDSMRERTGRSVEQWVREVQTNGPDPLDQKAVRAWLREEHGVQQNSQWAIADAAATAAGWVRPDVEGYIDSQYTGAKAALRPIFDRLREVIGGFGDDVSVEGRSGYTPFVRRRQFAAVAAATKQRVDVGLRLTQPPPEEMINDDLIKPSNGPGQSTYKVGVTGVDEVGTELIALLRLAYEQNG